MGDSKEEDTGWLTPTKDDDAAGAYQGRRKAYLPLSIEGVFAQKKKCPSAVRHWQSDI